METNKQKYYFWASKTLTKTKTVLVEADSEDEAAQILEDALDNGIIDFTSADECTELDFNTDDYPDPKYMQVLNKADMN